MTEISSSRVRTVHLYKGTSKQMAEHYTREKNPSQFHASSNGEFGVGSYFWLDDLPAAILTAVQYCGQEEGGWGVVELSFDPQAIYKLAESEQGYGSRVIDFKDYSRESPFERMDNAPRHFVIPKEYSHLHPDKNDKSNPEKTDPKPKFGSFGSMSSSRFRYINANPENFDIGGDQNKVIWQYDLVIGLCAADYNDKKLVQMKFANHGLTFLNNTTVVVRTLRISGKTIVKKWRTVQNWSMKDRESIYDKYFREHVGTKKDVNLDTIL